MTYIPTAIKFDIKYNYAGLKTCPCRCAFQGTTCFGCYFNCHKILANTNKLIQSHKQDLQLSPL